MLHSSQGSKKLKRIRIDKYVFDQFQEARKKRLPVKDFTLQQWAMDINATVSFKLCSLSCFKYNGIVRHSFLYCYVLVVLCQVELDNFEASKSWVHRWKKKHRIVSRKGTRVVSTKNICDEEQVKQSAVDFVNRIKPLVRYFGEKGVLNTDQSAFRIEMYSGRTLEIKGTAKVELSYQQSKSATHSYTVQPTFTADGRSVSPLLVVLSETNGEFGPRVRQTMYKHPNLCVKASTSGLVNKPILKAWYEDVFFPYCDANCETRDFDQVHKRCLLLTDALATYKDQEYYTVNQPEGLEYETEVIPGGTTGMIQPCDVGIFRPFKSFHTKISNESRLRCPTVQVYARDNILKLINTTHIQFSATIFRDFIRHSFVKSGYTTRHSDTYFETPRTFCFNNRVKRTKCEVDNCYSMAFIRCAWCQAYLCLHHLTFSDVFHDCAKGEIFSYERYL